MNISKNKTSIAINQSKEGETMETKMEKILSQKEPIKDKAPIIWTPKDEGVRPEFDIRTDRWEMAQKAMDLATKSGKAKRQKMLKDDGVLPEETQKSGEE